MPWSRHSLRAFPLNLALDSRTTYSPGPASRLGGALHWGLPVAVPWIFGIEAVRCPDSFTSLFALQRPHKEQLSALKHFRFSQSQTSSSSLLQAASRSWVPTAMPVPQELCYYLGAQPRYLQCRLSIRTSSTLGGSRQAKLIYPKTLETGVLA